MVDGSCSLGPGPSRVPRVEKPDQLTDVGARVTAILTAAEQAAQEIRRDADRAAAARVEELRAEAEAEARDLRLAAESYGKRQRQLADEEARRIVAEAEEKAKTVHAEEERRWQQRLAEAEGRLRTAAAEAEWLEAKRSRIVDSLRALSDDLADAIASNGNGEVAADDLHGALSPTRRRTR